MLYVRGGGQCFGGMMLKVLLVEFAHLLPTNELILILHENML